MSRLIKVSGLPRWNVFKKKGGEWVGIAVVPAKDKETAERVARGYCMLRKSTACRVTKFVLTKK